MNPVTAPIRLLRYASCRRAGHKVTKWDYLTNTYHCRCYKKQRPGARIPGDPANYFNEGGMRP